MKLNAGGVINKFMKKLIIMRGAPGAGKSTFIKEHNLHDYTLCPDELRMMCAEPVLAADGSYHIAREHNLECFVWSILRQMLEFRLKRGNLTVIDATCSRLRDLKYYKSLADLYGYKLIVVDFTDIPFETIIKQNKQRPRLKWVPEESILEIYGRYKSQASQLDELKKEILFVKPAEFKLED